MRDFGNYTDGPRLRFVSATKSHATPSPTSSTHSNRQSHFTQCNADTALHYEFMQDYKVHIKHTDGSFEYVPYFCLPAKVRGVGKDCKNRGCTRQRGTPLNRFGGSSPAFTHSHPLA